MPKIHNHNNLFKSQYLPVKSGVVLWSDGRILARK